MTTYPDDFKVFAEVSALVSEVKVLRAENEMLKKENARLDDLNKRILESMARSNSVDWTRWAKPNPAIGHSGSNL